MITKYCIKEKSIMKSKGKPLNIQYITNINIKYVKDLLILFLISMVSINAITIKIARRSVFISVKPLDVIITKNKKGTPINIYR